LEVFKRGKVRDVYSVGDKLLIVSTDRISAFDFVLPSLIPDKGKVLNQLSAFWFDYTKELFGNHIIDSKPENIEEFKTFKDEIAGRSVLTKKLETFPIEAIVRGYIVGSGWKTYQKTGEICGLRLEKGLRFADKFKEPIFTPTTKEDDGHDENITFDVMADSIGRKDAEKIRELSIALFEKASEYAAEKGIIIADSKFEFGRDENGNIVLIDEIFTPDSSRFWRTEDYKIGVEPPSYDKQFVRNFLLNSSWDRTQTPPALPTEIIESTRQKYIEIYKVLTGNTL
jgi:phosphoribosylaminoimidazole-succinocarboxamide synthase